MPLFNADGGTAQNCKFLGPTWMDDLAVCFKPASPDGLVSLTGRVTGQPLDLCAFHGMTPNLARGNTEIMMMFRGSG
jgi:hypothetical protein